MSCLAACLDALNPRETRGARVAGALNLSGRVTRPVRKPPERASANPRGTRGARAA